MTALESGNICGYKKMRYSRQQIIIEDTADVSAFRRTSSENSSGESSNDKHTLQTSGTISHVSQEPKKDQVQFSWDLDIINNPLKFTSQQLDHCKAGAATMSDALHSASSSTLCHSETSEESGDLTSKEDHPSSPNPGPSEPQHHPSRDNDTTSCTWTMESLDNPLTLTAQQLTECQAMTEVIYNRMQSEKSSSSISSSQEECSMRSSVAKLSDTSSTNTVRATNASKAGYEATSTSSGASASSSRTSLESGGARLSSSMSSRRSNRASVSGSRASNRTRTSGSRTSSSSASSSRSCSPSTSSCSRSRTSNESSSVSAADSGTSEDNTQTDNSLDTNVSGSDSQNTSKRFTGNLEDQAMFPSRSQKRKMDDCDETSDFKKIRSSNSKSRRRSKLPSTSKYSTNQRSKVKTGKVSSINSGTVLQTQDKQCEESTTTFGIASCSRQRKKRTKEESDSPDTDRRRRKRLQDSLDTHDSSEEEFRVTKKRKQ